jgi:hypothetical protein
MLSDPAPFDVKGSRLVHTDIPTRADLEQLLSFRGAVCVSIYLPTAPAERGGRDRREFKNLAAGALEQLTAASIERDRINNFREVLDDLADDDAFWARQAHSLAGFATPWGARTMTDYSKWSDEQLQKALEGRAGEEATEHYDAVFKVFEEDGAWTAGYFAPGEPERITDPASIAIVKAEGASSKRDALEGLAQLLDFEAERKERRKGG